MSDGGINSSLLSDLSTLTFVGLGLFGAALAGQRWVQGKVAELHNRINGVLEVTARKDDVNRALGEMRSDMHRELGLVRGDLKDMRTETKNAHDRINARFDALFAMLGKAAPPVE